MKITDTGKTSVEDIFGPPISSYSRAQAIEDGTLVDVTPVAREAGWRYPVAVTRGVWADVIVPDKYATNHGESESGRLWDVVWMASIAAKQARAGEDTIVFRLIATKGGRRHTRTLWAKVGPGDTAEPVVTIMLEGED